MSSLSIAKGAVALVPPAVRGRAIMAITAGVSQGARAAWSQGIKTSFSSGFSASKAAFKAFGSAKVAKAMNLLGMFDIAGDLLVDSDVDNSWWSVIPGSGIVQLGAAVANKITGQQLLGAKFAWE